MLAGYSFRPRLWALALALTACAAGIALGNWQSGRAEEKRAAAAELEKKRVALARLPHALRLGEEAKSRIRQNLDIADFARQTGLGLHPFVVEQHSDTGDGLLRDWPRPDAGAEKNEAYSFQWYSLAALAVVLALVLSFRKDEPAK